uniref:Uncharacterized protein n=1 Tax=Arundo donax TaxID=35708 RepID=A0A0A9BI85_ARUDO
MTLAPGPRRWLSAADLDGDTPGPAPGVHGGSRRRHPRTGTGCPQWIPTAGRRRW